LVRVSSFGKDGQSVNESCDLKRASGNPDFCTVKLLGLYSVYTLHWMAGILVHRMVRYLIPLQSIFLGFSSGSLYGSHLDSIGFCPCGKIKRQAMLVAHCTHSNSQVSPGFYENPVILYPQGILIN